MLTLSGADDTAAAIRRLAVRGAPLIGVAAAYGLAMEVARTPTDGRRSSAAPRVLAGARPTARNLGWAVERVVAAALARPDDARRRRPRRGRGDPRARTRRPAPRSPGTAPTRSTPCCRPGPSP